MANDIQFAYICGYLSGVFTLIVIIAVAVWINREGENPFCRKTKDSDAEELHINSGDTLYILLTQDERVIKRKVSRVEFGKTNDRIIFTDHSVYTIWRKNWKEYINKTVFKREKEAEQALARMEKENE